MMLAVFTAIMKWRSDMNNEPIAVMDSGVGGLACLLAIRDAMPNENIIYFGDTAHMPYGTKTIEELHSYARSIVDYLKSRKVKMIILACGTMSSTIVPFLYKEYPEILVQGVVDPLVAATSRVCSDGDRVGVIATPRSIESGSYNASFGRLKKKLEVYYKSCPDLSVYIEKGITDGPEMEELLRSYLDELVYKKKIGVLALGCTHYPLALDCIQKLYPELKLVRPEASLARNALSLLSVHEMDTDSEEDGTLEILASKKTEGFESMARMLGLEAYPVKEVSLQ